MPDSAGIRSTGVLGLTGATAAQFMVEGTWPSGNIKWLKVRAIVPSVSAGGTATVTLTDSGSGDFGGPTLATDNGATITVNTSGGTCGTGAATCFTVKKANFNVIDEMRIGATDVVLANASSGLSVFGPDPTAAYPGNVTCSPTPGGTACTTVYQSANDPGSTCSIEENGPATAVLKCSGDLMDGASHKYMHFTARLYFYQNKSYVKVTPILRNADYGASNTFASASKGHQGFELRIKPNLTGTLRYTAANHTGTATTGTLNQAAGTDYAYIYQAESNLMKSGSWCASGCAPYTTLSGYSIMANGSAVLTGTASQYPQGWADIADANGVGVEIGQEQFAAYGNKSLEFLGGGTDVRIGIQARENNTTGTSSTSPAAPYYMAWPQWSIPSDVYLNFHATTSATLANDFLKLQHPLLARAAYSWYNTAAVFTYPLLSPSEEDAYYSTAASSASPSVTPVFARDLPAGSTSTTDTMCGSYVCIFRFYPWPAPGGSNQMEFRLSHTYNFLRRGFTGGYLNAMYFYKFAVASAFPMSDGFNWSGKPSGEHQYYNYPTAASANSGKVSHDWVEADMEHGNIQGFPDFYFVSGDETIKEAVLEGYKDAFLDTTSTNNYTTISPAIWNDRAVGNVLKSIAHLYTFLSSTGDPDAGQIRTNGETVYNVRLRPDLCAYAGYPAGCTPDALGNNSNPSLQVGTSRVRGVTNIFRDTSVGLGNGCNGIIPSGVRTATPFMNSIKLEGMWEFYKIQTPSWPYYNQLFDLAYGSALWAFNEMYADNGQQSWSGNGFRYKQAIDYPNSCNASDEWIVKNEQTVWFPFFIRHQYEGGTTWQHKFDMLLQRDMSDTSTDEFFHYTTAAVIYQVNHPNPAVLSTVPLAGFTDNGGGSYTISWTVPTGAQSYRIKWGPKQIVDWIGFNAATYTFIGNPATTMNWFAATDAPNVPSPSGATQSLIISTGTTGLTAPNFMVKAYTIGGAPPPPPPADTTAPTVSVTAPAGGATVTGTVTVSATASDNVGVSSLQFKLDGAALGAPLAGGGTYTLSWDTRTASNGPHTLSATASDAAGNTGLSSGVSVTVSNTAGPPVNSAVVVSGSTMSTATITWTTNTSADSQVAYGTTTGYGSTSPLDSTMVTSHSVTLGGLASSTTYHFKVMSRDAQGNLGSSGDFTFATAAPPSGGSTPIPTGAWTQITPGGYTGVEAMGFEKSAYVSSRKISCFLGSYKEYTTSEANNAIVCYSYSENRWLVLQNNGYWHSTHAGQAGHSQSAFAYDSNRDSIFYMSDGSGSSQPADGFFAHFWQHDVGGLSGRDKQVATMAWMGPNVIPSFAYDSFDQKLLSWNTSKTLSVYDPVTNTMIIPSASGPTPNPTDANVNLVYNPDDHKTYLYGGYLAAMYSVQCTTPACSAVVWTQLATTCSGVNCSAGNPPVRARAAMAYSTRDHVFLVCAGLTGAGAGLTDTWIFDPATNAWSQQTPSSTYPNAGGYSTPYDRLTYDSDSNVFILVTNPGGYTASISAFPYTAAANYGRTTNSYSVPTGSLNRNNAGAQSWGFDPAIATANGFVYAGWVETGIDSDNSACGAAHHPMAQGSSSTGVWTQYGGCTSIAPELGGSTDSSKLKLAYVNGNLWESHEASNGPAGYISSAYARFWNGSAWTGGQVGCFTASCALGSNGKIRQYPAALIAHGATPTLAVIEANNNTYGEDQYLYVAQYSSGAWSKLGGTFLNISGTGSGTRATNASLATDGTNPAACWSEERIDPNSRSAVLSRPQIRCAQWNGSSWVGFGANALNQSTSNWAYDPAIAYLSGSFYVAWVERTTAGNNLLYACKWTGSSCTLLGGGALNINIATGWAAHPSLAADGTNLYLAWEEQADLNQHSLGYVKKWNGSSWSQVGGTLAADAVKGSVEGISLAVVNGAPTAIWGELSFGNLRQIYGQQWNGSTWQSINGTMVPPPPVSACDLNGDGVIDSQDIQLAINQALGIVACTNAALQQNGQCNVVGVQRVVNASLGGACSTLP